MAQQPPTGGAAPIEDDSVNPVVYIGGAVVVGAAAYLLLRPKGAKIPVGTHVTDYLRSHQIMPTPDAIELVYRLNPSLDPQDEIRESKN